MRKGGPKEFSKRLVAMLADRFTDRLMGGPNDLVVDTSSMTAIDLATGAFIKDRFDYGANATVYHTVYFAQQQTVALLARWLGIDGGAGARRTTRRPIRIDELEVPAAVSEDFLVLAASLPVAEAVRDLQRDPSEFVVIKRRHRGETLHYVRRSADVIHEAGGWRIPLPLSDALNLRETDRSPERMVEDVRLQTKTRTTPAELEVVLSGDGHPVGVLPDEVPALDSVELARRSGAAAATPQRRRSAGGRGNTLPVARGATGSGSGGGGRPRPPRRSPAGSPPRSARPNDKKEALFLVVAPKDVSIDLKRLHERMRASGRLSFGRAEPGARPHGAQPPSPSVTSTLRCRNT